MDLLDNRQVILTDDGWTMHSTGEDEPAEHRQAGLETLERLRELHPDRLWEFREFRACIHTANPQTNVCTDWSEEEGWSIWYR